MSISKSKIALAVAGVMALGAVGQAQAGAYATSTLEITDFTLSFNDPNNLIIKSFLFTANNTARLNGVSDTSANIGGSCGGTLASNDCGAAPNVLNPAPANAPGGNVTRLDNVFNFFGPGTKTYSNSDSVIFQSELTLDGTTRTRQIAESEVQATGNAFANAEITSTTGFEIEFSLTGDTVEKLVMDFNASPYVRAAINSLFFLNGNALANMTAVFTLTNDDTGESVTWSPQGTAADNCQADAPFTCTEDNDTWDLNVNRNTSSNGTDVSYIQGFGDFGISVDGLIAGNYSLGLSTLTSSSVRLTAVPEPGSLALLGLALAGLGLTSYRRKQA